VSSQDPRRVHVGVVQPEACCTESEVSTRSESGRGCPPVDLVNQGPGAEPEGPVLEGDAGSSADVLRFRTRAGPRFGVTSAGLDSETIYREAMDCVTADHPNPVEGARERAMISTGAHASGMPIRECGVEICPPRLNSAESVSRTSERQERPSLSHGAVWIEAYLSTVGSHGD